MTPYHVEVTFVFDDVEADDEEFAIAYCEAAFTHYVYHPVTNEIVNPESTADHINDADSTPPLVDFLVNPDNYPPKDNK